MVTSVTKLFNVGQKRPKGVAGLRYKGSVDMVDFHEIW
jgi:hypothetical protein